MKRTGFTLIELLVVIVIIGILSTISTATFKSYFGKARDAERQAAVQNIALMIKVDHSETWDDDKFLFSLAGLQGLFALNDFRLPKGQANICYYIGMSDGADVELGDDNEFIVTTWGETRSTAAAGTEGPLVDGTEAAVTALLATPPTKAAYACGAATAALAPFRVAANGGTIATIRTTLGDHVTGMVSEFVIGTTGALTVGPGAVTAL